MDHDRKFFDTFMLILGALMAFTVAMYFLANFLNNGVQAKQRGANPVAESQVEARIEPVGKVRLAGEAAPVIDKPEPAAAASAARSGDAVYNTACVACHGAGIAGAPKVGDGDAWAPRIAKGMDALYGNAINGFQGDSGMMPAKGGNMSFSDDEIRAAVDYMVENSK